jgi:hypothetical protein
MDSTTTVATGVSHVQAMAHAKAATALLAVVKHISKLDVKSAQMVLGQLETVYASTGLERDSTYGDLDALTTVEQREAWPGFELKPRTDSQNFYLKVLHTVVLSLLTDILGAKFVEQCGSGKPSLPGLAMRAPTTVAEVYAALSLQFYSRSSDRTRTSLDEELKEPFEAGSVAELVALFRRDEANYDKRATVCGAPISSKEQFETVMAKIRANPILGGFVTYLTMQFSARKGQQQTLATLLTDLQEFAVADPSLDVALSAAGESAYAAFKQPQPASARGSRSSSPVASAVKKLTPDERQTKKAEIRRGMKELVDDSKRKGDLMCVCCLLDGHDLGMCNSAAKAQAERKTADKDKKDKKDGIDNRGKKK